MDRRSFLGKTGLAVAGTAAFVQQGAAQQSDTPSQVNVVPAGFKMVPLTGRPEQIPTKQPGDTVHIPLKQHRPCPTCADLPSTTSRVRICDGSGCGSPSERIVSFVEFRDNLFVATDRGVYSVNKY